MHRLAALAAVLLPALLHPGAARAGSLDFKTLTSNTHVLMPGDGRLALSIDLTADKANKNERLPMNVALVIDRSGSMLGDKMEQTRAAAAAFVRQLGDTDTFSIISYSDDVRVDIPSRRANAAARQEAFAVIEAMSAAGSTNLSGGLVRGQEEVERAFAQGQVNRVILMSDGLANRGITDTKAIAQLARTHAQRGISVSTMGVGTDYAEDLMTAIADQGSGNYYFIQDAKQIAGVLSTELDRMFSTVAQATSVSIHLDDGVDLVNVYGYTFTRQGDVVTIPLAELFGGQRRSILVEVQLPLIREGRFPVVNVALDYLDVREGGKKTGQNMRIDTQVTRDAKLVEAGRNKIVAERIEEIRAATVMVQAADLLRDGRRDEAKELMKGEAERLRAQGMALGGSTRVNVQVEVLEKLQYDFDDSSLAPATIKATKARAYEQVK
jgi:Ca-activated chloride channel family protein